MRKYVYFLTALTSLSFASEVKVTDNVNMYFDDKLYVVLENNILEVSNIKSLPDADYCIVDSRAKSLKFYCAQCGKKYRTKEEYDKHLADIHGFVQDNP